mmetsp:Transcript_16590/g.68056  ORF Transcript_16590/g.68056 Transcript_16590/m.68056 type:complete len:154 (+) Transcript_16590:1149-1610(+)
MCALRQEPGRELPPRLRQGPSHHSENIYRADPVPGITTHFPSLPSAPAQTHHLPVDTKPAKVEEPGLATNTVAQVKVIKYRTAVADPEDFIPIALETYGRLANRMMTDLCRLMRLLDSDQGALSRAIAALNGTLWKGNAWVALNHRESAECSR